MKYAGPIAVFAAVMTLSTGAALAEDETRYPAGLYAGGSLGLSQFDDACGSLPGTLGSQFSCNDDDATWKVFLGWRPHDWVAGELSYVDLGEARANASAVSLTAKIDGYSVVGVLTPPMFEKVGFYLKGGAFFWDSEVSGPSSPTFNVVRKSDDRTGVAGGGFRWAFGEHIGIGIEWERYFDIGDTDVDNFSASLIYDF